MAIITHPHGPLTQLAQNLWYVTARTSQGIDRKMSVIRGADGELVLHDCLWLDDKTFAELDALGKVTTIFVPSWLHDFDGQRFAERYPTAHLCGLPATLKRLHKWKRLEPFQPAWLPKCVTMTQLPGLRQNEAVFEVQHPEGGASQIYCDALFNMPHGKGFKGWVFRVLGSSGPLRMTPIGRLLLKDRKAYVAWLRAQGARSDLRHIIVGHGRVASENLPTLLMEAADRL